MLVCTLRSHWSFTKTILKRPKEHKRGLPVETKMASLSSEEFLLCFTYLAWHSFRICAFENYRTASWLATGWTARSIKMCFLELKSRCLQYVEGKLVGDCEPWTSEHVAGKASSTLLILTIEKFMAVAGLPDWNNQNYLQYCSKL